MTATKLASYIRPTGLIVLLLSYLILSVLTMFVLPIERTDIAENVIDSLLTLTITWSSLYIASRGVEKSISISRNSDEG